MQQSIKPCEQQHSNKGKTVWLAKGSSLRKWLLATPASLAVQSICGTLDRPTDPDMSFRA